METVGNSAARNVPRRTVVRGAAWSVPVVSLASVAPATAASVECRTPVVVDWSTAQYRRISATAGVYTTQDPDGTGPLQPLTLTVQNANLGSNTQTGNQGTKGEAKFNENLAVRRSAGVGGSANPLVIHQSPVRDGAKTNTRTNANKSITNFTFSRPVSGLTFTIIDIDSQTNDFVDAVAIESSAGFTATKANTTYNLGTNGTGTLADPLRAYGWDTRVADSETRGNATIQFSSDVTTFNIHYWNQTAGWDYYIDGDQRIFLSSFRMTYDACP